MKYLVVIAIILCSALWSKIQSDPAGPPSRNQDNPNGSSELSLLMRNMQQYTNRAKASLKNREKPEPYPAEFDKVLTAKISDGMSKSDFYKQFADLYIMSVKNYAASTPETRIETYNNMVSACLACHSQHCPGPVPVIRKMIWEVK
jgi:hypothetical protein